jgi:hypothetical protein
MTKGDGRAVGFLSRRRVVAALGGEFDPKRVRLTVLRLLAWRVLLSGGIA